MITIQDMQDLSFFEGMRKDWLEKLISCSREEKFVEGAVILRTGKLATGFYVITGGTAYVEESINEESEIELETVGRGDFIGWSWMSPLPNWKFNVIALSPVNILWFEGETVADICKGEAELSLELMRRILAVMTRRIDALRSKVATQG